MLQVNYIRENRDEIIERLKIRNNDFTETIDKIIKIDEQKRAVQKRKDEAQAESNKIAKDIGQLYKEGRVKEATAFKEMAADLKVEANDLKEKFSSLEEELLQLLYLVPNVPNKIVPEGKSDADNEVVHEEGSFPNLSEDIKFPHWDLAKKYDLIDFELGVKITGAGFPVYKGKGARLQRALINFFLNEASDAGYQEIIPPLLVNEASGFGTGQFPDKEGQMYHCEVDDFYLIPTGEVPITNIYRDTIIERKEFPIKMAGYTPCFRREAGSYGKDVRGLNRLHQFDKVEIIQFQHPDESYNALDEMVDHVKTLLQKLELPFRITKLCGGDIGFTSALTFDMEVYSAAQERWLEVSSISNCETFQANRLKCRYRDENNKTQLVHTLNGSALALPRIMAALIENNQTAEGIKIPKALVGYTGFDMIS